MTLSDLYVSFMSYSKCWNSRRTWIFFFLLTFSWKKLKIKFCILGHLQKRLNSKKIKLQSSIRVICIILDPVLFSSEYLKDNKDSKIDDNFKTSNMTFKVLFSNAKRSFFKYENSIIRIRLKPDRNSQKLTLCCCCWHDFALILSLLMISDVYDK